MAITNKIISIHQLRKASGSKTGRTSTYTLQFRVTTQGQMGPAEILDQFPVGSPMQLYSGYWWEQRLAGGIQQLANVVLPWYTYPAAQPDCSSSVIWDPSNPAFSYFKEQAMLTEARIISRDANDTNTFSWIVACTFSDQTRDQGWKSSPVVSPRFPVKEHSVTAAYFRGRYRRIDQTEDPDPCSQSPGRWFWSCGEPQGSNPEGCPLPETTGTDAFPLIYPINSCGDPMSKPLKSSYSMEEYDVEWFSYTMLNLHCAVGKVNKNPYTLRAFDRPHPVPGSEAFWDQPNLIFCRSFSARELLVKDARCTPMNMNGRNCYKYNVTLVADENFHDAFMVDSGKRQRTDTGSPMPDGSTAEDGDTTGTSEAKTPVGDTGGPSGREAFLDGFGYPLNKAGDTVDPEKIQYLRYSHRLEIMFPTSNITQQVQYHAYEPDSDFQFMMDGGDRYLNPPEATTNYWPDCYTDDSRYPPTTGNCTPDTGGDEGTQPTSPQTPPT